MLKYITIFVLALALSGSIDKPKQSQNEVAVNTAFHYFNPEIKKRTVKHFFEVTRQLELDTNSEVLFDLAIQLCLESNARHEINGKINTSRSNALGIGQIKTGTCFDIFKSLTTEEHILIQRIDKRKDFLWAYKYPSYNREAEKEAEKWLEDEEMNLISWALLMRRYYLKYGSMCDAFMAYEQGETGRYNLLKMDINCSDMKYIIMHEAKKREVLDLLESKTSPPESN